MSKAVVVSCALAVLGIVVQSATAVPVHFSDFEGPVSPQWSDTSTEVTPVGARTYLGDFINEAVTLSLDSLPAHSMVSVEFDLFIIGSWDGNPEGDYLGPDIWKISSEEGTIFRTSFSNVHASPDFGGAPLPQSYPDEFLADNPPNTGAVELNTLGTANPWPAILHADAVYHLEFMFPHTASTLQLTFSGEEMFFDIPPHSDSERWGLDNVLVNLLPEPATLSLLALGGLFMCRRQR